MMPLGGMELLPRGEPPRLAYSVPVSIALGRSALLRRVQQRVSGALRAREFMHNATLPLSRLSGPDSPCYQSRDPLRIIQVRRKQRARIMKRRAVLRVGLWVVLLLVIALGTPP